MTLARSVELQQAVHGRLTARLVSSGPDGAAVAVYDHIPQEPGDVFVRLDGFTITTAVVKNQSVAEHQFTAHVFDQGRRGLTRARTIAMTIEAALRDWAPFAGGGPSFRVVTAWAGPDEDGRTAHCWVRFQIFLDDEGQPVAGEAGASAYEIWLAAGNSGSEADFLASLIGAAGADGTAVLSGTSDPTAGDGSDGDFWINTTSWQIFGPKALGAWPAPGTSLVGPQGPAGSGGGGGAVILSGVVDPSSGVGADGDFYVNTASSTWFGPKAGGAWPAGVALIGPAGPTGATGPQGDPGADGATGPQGPQGDPGADGATGPAGAAGADGAAVLSGASDPSAGDGLDGDFWINTTSWQIFGPKALGAWPAPGTSLVGPQGPAGSGGGGGAVILSGVVDPSSGVGADGDFYVNTASSTWFGPKAGGAWPAGVALIGPAGPTGATGPQGDPGADGAAGATGPQGDPGADGATGPQGPQGDPGADGAVGATGPAGAAGADGADGAAVLSGASDPSAGDGLDGDFWINTTSWQIFGPKALGAWPTPGASLVGPQGPAGSGGGGGGATARFREVLTLGNQGPTATANADNIRGLNTVDKNDDPTNIAFSAPQFTLQPGSYRFFGLGETYQCGSHVVKIHNVTDGVVALRGVATRSRASASVANASIICGEVTVSGGAKVFELRHYVSQAGVLGRSENVDADPTYSLIEITRL